MTSCEEVFCSALFGFCKGQGVRTIRHRVNVCHPRCFRFKCAEPIENEGDSESALDNYIARTPEELYPDREDLRDLRESLPADGFPTNLNNVLKKAIIKLATEVAGLTFGNDVIVEF